MKMRNIGLLLGACLLAGCWQKSLHPFYTPADVEFDRKLAGDWQEKKDSEPEKKDQAQVWTFVEGGDKDYKLTIKADDATHEYSAHLFRLDGERLLDIIPVERAVSTIPAHNLFKVALSDGSLDLAPLNTDWVQKWLRKNPGALPYVAVTDRENPNDREKDELVLTAETKALQRFLRAHFHEEDFFVDPTKFKPMGAKKK
jgi:hypothetical protein